MPLCNIPLIEYTMELLATAHIFEVFIVCTTHIDAIKNYFEYVYSLGKTFKHPQLTTFFL